ncbi:MAG: DUF3369 domain-containing protein [Magnetococcus sp. DMHC-6]
MEERKIRTIRKKNSGGTDALNQGKQTPWKLLIVDDEPDIHSVTALSLDGFRFQQRPLKIINAYSGIEARQILATEPDIAMALIDVVMESDTAGLDLVKYIRQELQNLTIRLIIRTGQPGMAPEREVIVNYDIDDYKEKTELTSQKLFSTVRSGIKSYCDLMIIQNNRAGLEYILKGAPELYRLQSLNDFFKGILTQVVTLCRMNESSFITGRATLSEPSALLAFAGLTDPTYQDLQIRIGTGIFSDITNIPDSIKELCLGSGDCITEMDGKKVCCLPIQAGTERFGFVYLEQIEDLTENDKSLLKLFIHQCGAAIENFRLYQNLELFNTRLTSAHEHAMDMLAVASELKDKETGNHINRIGHYSENLSKRVGQTANQSRALGLASKLHDLGKLGIPDRIIQKPDRLTADEFAVIKTHPQLSLEILGDDPWFELARNVAYCHHEKWDGSGYPQGLKGEEIPLAARIVAVADVFDALTSLRPYKHPWPVDKAMAEIERCAGVHFDPEVVKAFLAMYHDGEISRIMELFPSFHIEPEKG